MKVEEIWAWPAGAANWVIPGMDFIGKLRQSGPGQLELRTGEFEQLTDRDFPAYNTLIGRSGSVSG